MAYRPNRRTWGDYVILIFMVYVIVITLYPFLNVTAKSFNDPLDTVKGGVGIWPRVFTVDNYKGLFEGGSNLPAAFRMSVLRTVVGTAAVIVCCSMFAFTLSRRDFMFRRGFTVFMVVTMYVGGGLIPDYVLIRNLGLIDNFWVYVLPWLVNAFIVIVVRAYIETIPISLQESAKIDGANDFSIFVRIILPLCKPVLATVALFVAVWQWGSWFDTYLYARQTPELSTLQYELMKILDSASMSGNRVDPHSQGLQMTRKSPEAIKMAITVIATVPILFVYPFLQKYFVTGITLGAVKE